MNTTKLAYTLLGAMATGGVLFVACAQDGRDGPPGPAGPAGEPGAPGNPGPGGATVGAGGRRACQPSTSSSPRATGLDPTTPLSAMVAVTFVDPGPTKATNLAEYVKALVDAYARGELPEGFQFPLAPASTDTVRTIQGLRASVVAKWLDPLTRSDAPGAPRFGANGDYIAYFGDGWGDTPIYGGSSQAGYVWVNHEYVSGISPAVGGAPTSQHLVLARWMRAMKLLSIDVETAASWDQVAVDTYTAVYKKQVGGSWFHIVQDPASCEWSIDRARPAVRYDATSDTRLKMTGYASYTADSDDSGVALPPQVVAGIAGDCSGGQTPWGTVISAEENVQDYYGDVEFPWSDETGFDCDAGCPFRPGVTITFDNTPSPASEFGKASTGKHPRDVYGYLAEMDPGQPADKAEVAGVGHKKLGVLGRARWENATFATDEAWKLADGKPIVVYAGDDRRGGRIFKFVSKRPYTADMTRAQIRALLDEGTLYVAHFAGLDNKTGNTMLDTNLPPYEEIPGMGRWIALSLDSTDLAPNADALGTATKTVGQALADDTWNGIGGFASDDDVRRALFTAANKIGVMELNRPEDLEWNPRDASGKARLYVAFTNHGRKTQLDQSGKLRSPADFADNDKNPRRSDAVGAIYAIEEADPASPGASPTFKFFEVWRGSTGDTAHEAANPDNLLIDKEGGVWFGTDGNFGTSGNRFADALYYLDLSEDHRAGKPLPRPTYGLAFRVVAAPSDAEATGPAMTPDQGTLFFNVQHPGESSAYSNWPQ